MHESKGELITDKNISRLRPSPAFSQDLHNSQQLRVLLFHLIKKTYHFEAMRAL